MTYTIANPKKVKNYANPEDENFTGVAIDIHNNIAYFKNSKWHCTDGPAIIFADQKIYYYQNDKLHRTDGPAVMILPFGRCEYWINDMHLQICSDKELQDYLTLRMFE